MTVSKSAPFWRCQLHRGLQVHHATRTLKVANSRVLGAGLLPDLKYVSCSRTEGAGATVGELEGYDDFIAWWTFGLTHDRSSWSGRTLGSAV